MSAELPFTLNAPLFSQRRAKIEITEPVRSMSDI
jgi:hypothetical protein